MVRIVGLLINGDILGFKKTHFLTIYLLTGRQPTTTSAEVKVFFGGNSRDNWVYIPLTVYPMVFTLLCFSRLLGIITHKYSCNIRLM